MTSLSPRRQMRSRSLGLLSIVVLLIACAAFTFGLTFAPCHSSICVEHWFPSRTRIHIATFYGGVSIVAAYLTAWSKLEAVRSFSDYYLLDGPIPVIGARLSVGGTLLTVWILPFTLATTGYWLHVEHAFWLAKGTQAGWTPYMFRVTWAGVTGHWCDILVGLVFLPVSRNNVIFTAFGVQASTLLLAHKVLAYTLCAFGLIHGLLYYSFLAAWVAAASFEPVFAAFNSDNPFYTWEQVKQLGIYGWFVLPTGAIAGIVLIPTMLVTALPIIRRKRYDTFYYIHVIFALLVTVALCLHASTNFYFILPGLLLWLYDWMLRTQNALFYKQTIQVESAGGDWYRMRLPNAPDMASIDVSTVEKGLTPTKTSEVQHPLETYYIRLSAISKVRIHPFTAAAPANATSGPAFLFQTSPPKKKDAATDKEWTWRLAAMVNQAPRNKPLALESRIEGPYTTSPTGLYAANYILAIVGGTGITGALSIANWWVSRQCSPEQAQHRLKIVWSIRDAKMADIAEVQALRESHSTANIDLQIHVSSQLGHMNPEAVLDDFVKSQPGSTGNTFVYVSGPEGLTSAAETACVKQKRLLRASRGTGTINEFDWYSASFAV